MSPELPPVSIVVIGRNEGERLVRCLESIRALDYPGDRLELIYVDSASSDGSCEVARQFGAAVIPIRSGPLSAARARNLGWRQARHELVHFFDGDCIVHPSWLRKAVARIEDPSLACVFGCLQELHPHESIYMRVCSLDWYMPPGPWRTCGGNALFRRNILARTGGLSEDLPAGEEPELSYRVRRMGLQIWRLDEPMVQHDLGMNHFGQYCHRIVRSGWAYAVVAARCWRGPERLWVRENLVNALEVGTWAALLAASVAMRSPGPFVLLALLILSRTLWIAVRVRRRAETRLSAILYGAHCQFSRFPFLLGQIQGAWYVLRGRARHMPQPDTLLPEPTPAGTK